MSAGKPATPLSICQWCSTTTVQDAHIDVHYINNDLCQSFVRTGSDFTRLYLFANIHFGVLFGNNSWKSFTYLTVRKDISNTNEGMRKFEPSIFRTQSVIKAYYILLKENDGYF